jgi:hypothetical protein
VTNVWRKYAIHYAQPAIPGPAKDSGPRRERHQRDDYQSLLAKIQIIELEVKLLKEAFRMHAIISPARPDAPRPVFAAAYKNSNMPAQNPSSTASAAPDTATPAPQIEGTKLCSQHPPLNGLHQPDLQATRQSCREIDDFLRGNSKDLTNEHTAALGNNQFVDSWRFEQIKSLSPNLQTRQRDSLDQTLSIRPCLPATHGIARERPASIETASEKAAGELNNFQKLEVESQKFPTEGTIEDQSTSSLSSTPCMLQTSTYAEPSCSFVEPVGPQQSSSKSLMDLEPEAEIARFPTIFQLEKEGLQSVKGKNSTGQASGHSSSSLARANTVTSSNPAARLLKPFDPATEGFGVPPKQSYLPRRSGTEQHRRRPCAEQFGGAGRTLWEEFERSAVPQTSTTAPGSASNSKPLPVDVQQPRTLPFINRSQSLNQHHPLIHRQSHRVAPMRSAMDFSDTTHNRRNRTVLEQPQPFCEDVTVTPDPVLPRPTNPNHKFSKRIQTCIRSLQEMGYKPPSRLPIYAEACDGNVSKAMEMAEEDEKATQETQKTCEEANILNCVKQLKEMGYSSEYRDEELKELAADAGGSVGIAVDKLEAPPTRGMDEWRQRLRNGSREGGGMPGSFP